MSNELSLIVTLVSMGLFFPLVGIVFRICGKIAGAAFSLVFWVGVLYSLFHFIGIV